MDGSGLRIGIVTTRWNTEVVSKLKEVYVYIYTFLMYVYVYILLIDISNIYMYIMYIYICIGCSQGPQGDGSRRGQHSRGRSIITKPLYY